MDEYVSGSLASNLEDKRKIKSEEARALKIQRISANTDRAFSSPAVQFRNTLENAEFQVQRGPGYTTFCNQPCNMGSNLNHLQISRKTETAMSRSGSDNRIPHISHVEKQATGEKTAPTPNITEDYELQRYKDKYAIF